MKLRPLKRHARFGSNRGYSIVEAAVAGAILAFFLSGMYDSNWRAMALMKAGREGTSAARLLENRVEQVRTATWSEITNKDYIKNTLLASTTASNDMGNLLETITINQYPLPGGYTQGGALPQSAISATRDSTGHVQNVQDGNNTLSTVSAIRVDVTAAWSTTLTSTTNTRMMSTVISQSGILGQNQ